MSKKERDFNKSLGQEKARVKLYKSGKSWVKASISEFELLRTMGVPFLSKNIKKEGQAKDNKGSKFKKNAAKTTALVGGAFTFNMLQDHHALAASETPMTSEISSNSGTVANQNSTTIRNSQAKVTNNTVSNSTQQSSEIKNSTTKTSSSEVINKNESSSEKAINSNQNSESIKKEASESTNKAQNSEQSQSSSEKSSISKSTVSNTSSTNNEKDSQQPKKTSTSEKTSQESQQLKSTSQSSNNKKEGQSTLTQHSQSATQKDASNHQASTHTSEKPTINKNSQSASESAKSKVSNLRTFSRMSVFKTLAATPAASTTTATSSVSSNSVVVTKDNFNDNMSVSGSATCDPSTGIVTLTPDEFSKKGAISLNTRLDSNRSFRFTGKVNLGNRYEGFHNSTDNFDGGDGIGFAFSPGNLGEIGKEGAAVGIGGLKNAFGFKLDTFHNTSKPKADAKAYADPPKVGGGGAFGAFVSTDANGMATTDATTAAKLNVQPTDNSFRDFVIDYNGDTKVMTITYAGQTWTKNMSQWIKSSGSTSFSLSMTASTGGGKNLQQVKFGEFEYTQSATAQVRYVDAKTGKDIIPPKTYAGEVDGSATIDKQIDALKSKGYNYSGVDSTGAPNYTDSTGTVKLTNAGQTIIYKFDDAQKPTISVSNQTVEVGKPTSPINVTVTDNSSDTVETTLTGLPDGLSFDSTTNTITGTPTHVGSTTVQVHSEDSTGNTSDSSFVITVKDTIGPTITQISNQSSEVYNPINPITISTTDNSGAKVVNDVSGLPDGLTFDSNTNTISGTPSKMGSFTITITSKDETGNTSTSTFKYDVTRNSTSDSISTSSSKSLSTLKSNSVANSESASTSSSESVAKSTSKSISESNSLKASESTSKLASTSVSDSDSASTSTSTSTSLSESELIIIKLKRINKCKYINFNEHEWFKQ